MNLHKIVTNCLVSPQASSFSLIAKAISSGYIEAENQYYNNMTAKKVNTFAMETIEPVKLLRLINEPELVYS
jgi:hypothetical protein